MQRESVHTGAAVHGESQGGGGFDSNPLALSRSRHRGMLGEGNELLRPDDHFYKATNLSALLWSWRGRVELIRAIFLAVLHGMRVEKLLEIIHEDAELLVINKSAGLVCHPTKDGPMSSLVGRVRVHLGDGSRPHLVNRLDRETSGVTLAAKTEAVARELRRLWESREVEKEYLAIVHGHVEKDHGMIDAPLGKDEMSRIAIKDCVRADGLPSQTEFFVELKFSRLVVGAGSQPTTFSLLRVRPRTGRKHQIRIHLAHLGHPIVGDKIYGGDEDLYLSLVEGRLDEKQKQKLILAHQALHARAVRFNWRRQQLEFACKPEQWFTKFCDADLVVGTGSK